MKNSMISDTIATISTANAPGGIGIVRISGADAVEIADRIFTSKGGRKIGEIKGYSALYGMVHDLDDEKIDEAIALFFRAPKSYTGENVVELSCHGGMYVTKRLLSAVIDAGARPAEAGEFTKRAFLNGRIDLAQAESVMQIISAKAEDAAKAAIAGSEGNLSRKIVAVREQIKDTAAHLAAWADFPDEDIPQVDEETLGVVIDESIKELDELLRGFEQTKIFTSGVDAVIVGRTNAGKSTLMNLLSGRQRSIVTDIEGTTRDVVEEDVIIAGVPVRLSDTAGIRDTNDPVEQIGVETSRGKLASAQLVLAMFDASQSLDEHDMEIIEAASKMKSIAIVNKTDLEPKMDTKVVENRFENVVFISAENGLGLGKLEDCLELVLNTADYDPSRGVLLTERQRKDVETARNSLFEASEAHKLGMTLDAVTVCVEDALEALYALTGERVSDEVVDGVFSKFCVGK